VFQNRALRRIFGPKLREDNLRKIHNDDRPILKQWVMTSDAPFKLHNLYSSPNIIRLIKIRRGKGAGNVECIELYKYRKKS
jgi:hypothetical protein